ncbi:hypothetical protein C0J52_17674 [Blattella germanica]|nr:hypothetical protein C0J52_17674 [Blattella germanica]
MTSKVSTSLAGLLLICYLFDFAHGAINVDISGSRTDTAKLKADVPQYDDYEKQIFYYTGNISFTPIARNHSISDIYEEGWSIDSMSVSTSWGLEGTSGTGDFTDGGLSRNYWEWTWFLPGNVSATYEVEIEVQRPISGSH